MLLLDHMSIQQTNNWEIAGDLTAWTAALQIQYDDLACISDTACIFGSPAPPENLQKHICGSMTTFAKTVLDCLSSAVKQHVQDGGLAAVLGWMTTFHASSPGEQNRYSCCASCRCAS